MKVAVVGSWKDKEAAKWKLKDHESFAKACREIGAAIVRNGHRLVIGSDSVDTADRHSAEGAIQALGGARQEQPRIIILRPNDQKILFEQERREVPGLFTARTSIDSKWNVSKLLQVNEADAVVVVGGADYSYQAGLAAVVCPKPMVAVGSFGGAAKELLNVLSISKSMWRGSLPSEDDIGSLHGPWTSFMLDKVIALLGLSRPPRILIVHGHSEDWMDLKNYLQNSLNLPEPVLMREQDGRGLTLPEKFEQIANECDAAIALATPDDVAGSDDSGGASAPAPKRARQNVWLEVGWFWGKLGRERFLLLCREGVDLPPSDLQGIESYKYQRYPAEKGEDLRRFVGRVNGSLKTA